MFQPTVLSRSLRIVAIVLLTFLSATTVRTQDVLGPTDQGIFLLRAGSNFSVSFSDGTPLSLNAGAGFFVIDNLPVGIDVLFASDSGFNSTTIRPFLRYYIAKRFFLGGGFNVFDVGGLNVTGFDVEAGIALFIDDMIAIEPTVIYPLTEGADLSAVMRFSIYF